MGIKIIFNFVVWLIGRCFFRFATGNNLEVYEGEFAKFLGDGRVVPEDMSAEELKARRAARKSEVILLLIFVG